MSDVCVAEPIAAGSILKALSMSALIVLVICVHKIAAAQFSWSVSPQLVHDIDSDVPYVIKSEENRHGGDLDARFLHETGNFDDGDGEVEPGNDDVDTFLQTAFNQLH